MGALLGSSAFNVLLGVKQMRTLFTLLCLGVTFCSASSVSEVIAGTVKGRVSIKSGQRHSRPARYYRGPFRGGGPTQKSIKSGPHEVIVHVEGVSGSFVPPAHSLRMVQKNETFVPRVLPVLSGSLVEFPNQDNFYHNVFSVVSGDRFDLGRFPKGKSAGEVLSKPGVVVVRCEIHPRMKAYIKVLENPFFATPDPNGDFVIGGVPSGTYTVKAWHPTKGEQERSVSVPPTGEVQLSFKF